MKCRKSDPEGIEKPSDLARLMLQGTVNGKWYRLVVERVDRKTWVFEPVTGHTKPSRGLTHSIPVHFPSGLQPGGSSWGGS